MASISRSLPAGSRRPSSAAMAPGTSAGSRRAARATRRTGLTERSARAAADAKARRVLPTPPVPLSVSRRAGPSTSSTIRCTWSPRPTSGVSSAGSLPRGVGPAVGCPCLVGGSAPSTSRPASGGAAHSARQKLLGPRSISPSSSLAWARVAIACQAASTRTMARTSSCRNTAPSLPCSLWLSRLGCKPSALASSCWLWPVGRR